MSEAKPKLPPDQVPVSTAQVSVRGIWGNRLESSSREWMLNVDEDTLLTCFQKKPGIQPWIGEHIGKFSLGALPTAALLAGTEVSRQLKAKLARLMRELIAAQEPDGYLGTY